MSDRILLGDIGGTNLRFAWMAGEETSPLTVLPRAEYQGLADAIADHLEKSGSSRPDAMALAVAGPVRDNRVVMTNAGWHLDAAALGHRLGVPRVHLVNDFAATAWSLSRLSASDLVQIGGSSPPLGGIRVVCGPGTGLGVAAVVPTAEGEMVIAGEAGHMTLAGQDAQQDAVIARLRNRFGHVSAERALSGPGLENLHAALTEAMGRKVVEHTAAEIVIGAREGRCEMCRLAIELFCSLLGGFAGDLALAFGARGGVYLAGGILPRMLDLLRASDFRMRFEAKGRFHDYLAPVPAFAILHPEPAILGLQAMIAARHI